MQRQLRRMAISDRGNHRGVQLRSPGFGLRASNGGSHKTRAPAISTSRAVHFAADRVATVSSCHRGLSFNSLCDFHDCDEQSRMNGLSTAKMWLVKLSALTILMDALAEETWHSIVDSRSLDVDFGELAASQHNLLAIARLADTASLNLKLVRVSQNDEKRIGADWEFWLRLQTGQALGYSIQAKKAYIDSSGAYEYRALGHPGELRGEFQYDTLIRHAAKHQSIPMHVFYNGWTPPNGIPFAIPPNFEQYGCSAVSTHVVRNVRSATRRKGMNRVSNYASASMPWSDLFRLSPAMTPATPAAQAAMQSGPRSASSSLPSVDAISLTQSDLLDLASRMSERASHGTQFSLASKLPDYVTNGLNSQGGRLPIDNHLPRFAVVLTES